jgi:hypothetical protein
MRRRAVKRTADKRSREQAHFFGDILKPWILGEADSKSGCLPFAADRLFSVPDWLCIFLLFAICK